MRGTNLRGAFCVLIATLAHKKLHYGLPLIADVRVQERMNLKSFIQEEKEKLISQLSQYLSQNISNEEIQSHVNKVFDAWERMEIDNLAYQEGEKEFWCSLWAIQHLASEDHWQEGVTQKDLGFLLSVLKGKSVLPESFEGRRP